MYRRKKAGVGPAVALMAVVLTAAVTAAAVFALGAHDYNRRLKALDGMTAAQEKLSEISGILETHYIGQAEWEAAADRALADLNSGAWRGYRPPSVLGGLMANI